jgi:hypothetical protein
MTTTEYINWTCPKCGTQHEQYPVEAVSIYGHKCADAPLPCAKCVRFTAMFVFETNSVEEIEQDENDLKRTDIDSNRVTKKVAEPGQDKSAGLRCVNCGCSRWDAKGYKCVHCGGSPSVRSERCHINEDTKGKLLAHADHLKEFGITIEKGRGFEKIAGAGETVAAVALVIAVADSFSHDDGVLRRLVVYLRNLAIPEEEILRLRLDEPEKILTYSRADKKPER